MKILGRMQGVGRESGEGCGNGLAFSFSEVLRSKRVPRSVDLMTSGWRGGVTGSALGLESHLEERAERGGSCPGWKTSWRTLRSEKRTLIFFNPFPKLSFKPCFRQSSIHTFVD